MFDLPEPKKTELPEELQKTELNWPYIDYVRDRAVASPAAAVEFNGVLEIFYVRQTENGNVLAHTQFIGSADKNRVITVADGPEFAGISGLRPAVLVYEHLLYCFYVRTDKAMCYSIYDGAKWTGPHRAPVDSMSGPGVAVEYDAWSFDLTLVFQEMSKCVLSIRHYNGSKWSSRDLDSNPTVPLGGVAVAAFEDMVYVALNDIMIGEGTYIMPMLYDVPQTEINLTYSAAGSPSLCASKGKLYCASAHKSTNACLISSYSDSVWSEPQAIHGLRLKGSPCLAEFKGSLYLLSVNTVGVDIFKCDQ
ncbi:hypothetical protein [Pseudomonas mucidolens]|uniref:Exo-alpha-sialidase n=1 Tax=Pseudomonas mucidolens TaxID=46679 RepID=A0A1H2P1W6_9PSED|nr:hypothetical protein [Pseudomonas mucidolens]SDV11668.1 hypothetical protein SAMN05216202_5322 [Pseudomonas mucidolens]SQH36544.1 Uncharacterised protein [Pseudomonas mucidolens]